MLWLSDTDRALGKCWGTTRVGRGRALVSVEACTVMGSLTQQAGQRIETL